MMQTGTGSKQALAWLEAAKNPKATAERIAEIEEAVNRAKEEQTKAAEAMAEGSLIPLAA